MSHTAQELATLVNGTLHGPGDRPVRAAAPIHDAGPEYVTFLEHERSFPQLKDCKAGVIVVPVGVAARLADRDLTAIEVRDPLEAFIAIFQHLQGPPYSPPIGVSPRADVDPTATLGPDCRVQPFAVVGPGAVLGPRCVIHSGAVVGPGCVLGADVVLHPNAVLYHRIKVGDRVVIHAGAVIGADGFGYRFQAGQHVKVPHLGTVEVEDDVEIGANATIDRGTFQATRIGKGSKIDNLVQVAHNCRIGAHNLLAAQVGIAGSCTTGQFVAMGGQVGIADHATMGDGVQIAAGSKVPRDVPAGETVLGYPAIPLREARRMMVSQPKLPELVKDVRAIKKRLGMPLKEAG